MSVQKAIFPGIAVGILFLLGMVSLLRTAAVPVGTNQPAALQAGVALQPALAQAEPEAAASDTQPAAAWDGSCTIGASYPDTVRQWCELIEQYARDNSLEPELVSAVMLQESNGQPDAYSKSGAVGLMQVMPRDGLASKFMCKNGPCFSDRPSMEELFDPEYNLAYSTRMLAGLIQHYGNVREALKAYGPKDVGYYYADLVISIMNRYQ